jgi:ABC-2 type transport system ATP-binding protein/lipopolysaccharide transport system ATP-binding protein
VVLASHSDTVIRQMCNKALWMDRGRIREFGPMNEVAGRYAAAQSIT